MPLPSDTMRRLLAAVALVLIVGGITGCANDPDPMRIDDPTTVTS